MFPIAADVISIAAAIVSIKAANGTITAAIEIRSAVIVFFWGGAKN